MSGLGKDVLGKLWCSRHCVADGMARLYLNPTVNKEYLKTYRTASIISKMTILHTLK